MKNYGEVFFRSSIEQLKWMGLDKFYESSQLLILILENTIKEFDIEFKSIKSQYSKIVVDCLSAIRKDYLNQLSLFKRISRNWKRL